MPLIRGRAKGGPLGGSRLNEGFLGTAAPRYADVVLLLEIGMGAACGARTYGAISATRLVSVHYRTPELCRYRTDYGPFISFM